MHMMRSSWIDNKIDKYSKRLTGSGTSRPAEKDTQFEINTITAAAKNLPNYWDKKISRRTNVVMSAAKG